MLNKIYNDTNYIEKALDGIWLRNKAISNNIANADTPNYKKKTVVFEDCLKQEIECNKRKLVTTNEKHFSGIGELNKFNPKVIENKNLSYRFDGNNVNKDVEMAELSKNTIMYDALIRQLTDEYDKIKSAIIEGSK